MTATRKRNYLVVMALCAAALLVDRLFLADPAPVTAADVSIFAVDPKAPRAAAAGNDNPSLTVPEIPFPPGVQSLPSDVPLKDPFAQPASANHAAATSAAAQGPDARDDLQERSALGWAAFREKHRLHGVLTDEGLKIAVVDDRLLRTGDVVDGCALRSVEPREVIFACRDGDAILRLDDG
jgi:hypothetical protein